MLTIIDETDRVLKQQRIPNKLERFVAELEPFRTTLQGVAIESTFNWYWLARSERFGTCCGNEQRWSSSGPRIFCSP